MKKNQSRRDFLKKSFGAAVGLAGAPLFIPSSALGRNGFIPPSDKITVGCIGVGWQGGGNTNGFLHEPDVKVVAVCDVDDDHIREVKGAVDKYYGNKDCKAYKNFEEILLRKDIDAMSLALPDHWHAIPAIAAAKAGFDIFGEKPLSHKLAEGRAMVNAVKRYGRIWQTGSWQRSLRNFRFAAELVRNGRIGKIHTVEVGLPSGLNDFEGTKDLTEFSDPPSNLDYNKWLGPAPYTPYAPAKLHKNWRWHMDYGGGQLMDWVGHHVDIAHWGLGFDKTGPVKVKANGEWAKNQLWNTPVKYRVDTEYENGVKMVIAGGHSDICNGRTGTKWIGDDGWVWVSRQGIDANPQSLLMETLSPNETHLYKSPGHFRNFIDCIKSREETITPAETAHRSATPGHLGMIALILGRELKFDPKTEKIIGDETANEMLSKDYRSPWQL